MKIRLLFYSALFFALLVSNFSFANRISHPPKKGSTTSLPKTKSNYDIDVDDAAPIIKAEGAQIYCPSSFRNIVTSISITDPDPIETPIAAIYIQISSGYVKGEDTLSLDNTLSPPTVTADPFNANEGKLILKSSTGTPATYADLEKAIKNVQFKSSSSNPKGTRSFSISIGSANYLPRNGHYYRYIPDLAITWTNARIKAEAAVNKYFGLQGYLATLTAADEAQLAGKQAPGAGWIGGTDEAIEGEWRWVTGPEGLTDGGKGLVFWEGNGSGYTPNFAYWNTNNGEPNNAGNENYAHITAPGIGNPGSWNDLSNTGDLVPGSPYQPKGYIVEYGDTPGDPTLHLSASTSLKIAEITSTTPSSTCDAGTITLKATTSTGTINWYDAAIGGNSKGTGTSFTTPILTTTTSYFVDAGCPNSREEVIATVNVTPSITQTNTPVTRCGQGTFILKATTSAGTINWYSQNDGSSVGSGSPYTTLPITATTTYYAEAVDKGCVNHTKTPVDLIIYPLPIVSDQTRTKCVSQTITLDAGLPAMNYLWSTGATTQTIDVIDKGVFFVDVTSPSPQSCTSRKTITVLENSKPEIKNVVVDETTVTIELVKNEDYFEFSIDGINFQSSNVFTNPPGGLQTAYVREVNLCSGDQKTFIFIIVPKFFTPNNDNHNDFWTVKGLADYPLGEVTIFDRYGKIITVLNLTNQIWDGTLNKRALPASDYWYVLKLDPNSPEVRGHFSLKR